MNQPEDTDDTEGALASLASLLLPALRGMCAKSEEHKLAVSTFAAHCRDGDISLSAAHVAILKDWYLIESDGSIRDFVKVFVASCAVGEGSSFRLRGPMAADVH